MVTLLPAARKRYQGTGKPGWNAVAPTLLSYSSVMIRARVQQGLYMKPKSSRDCRRVVGVICVAACLLTINTPVWSQSSVTITLTGQSMIRSDLRATAPLAVPRIQALLKGDVIFTNLEGTVAETGQSVQEGRGFLTPPEALDALHALGFNLLSLSNNHAFDLKGTGIENTLRELNRRKIVHAGTGLTLVEAAAPAYLPTSNVTVPLVSSASGLIAPGAAQAPTGPASTSSEFKRVTSQMRQPKICLVHQRTSRFKKTRHVYCKASAMLSGTRIWSSFTSITTSLAIRRSQPSLTREWRSDWPRTNG